VASSEGVAFVPALAGLGAPHWDEAARGTIRGLTLASRPAHLARATLEAIALQVADVFKAMERDVGRRLDALRADGGASASDFLMQSEADLLDQPVTRGGIAEVGALGVAAMAFEALGQPMATLEDKGRTFLPNMDEPRREAIRSVLGVEASAAGLSGSYADGLMM
jgi:glycerol kinase